MRVLIELPKRTPRLAQVALLLMAAACGGDTSGPNPVALVSVTPNGQSLVAGTTAQLSATPRDAQGNALAGRAVAWSSSSDAVASVSASGLVSAASPGSAQIRATSEGVTGEATVTVTPVPVATVTVSVAASSIVSGATTQATATLKDAQGNVLVGRTIAWSTANAAIASVSQTGLVTGVSTGGPVTITATSEGMSGGAEVTVTPVPPVGRRTTRDRPDEVSGLQIKIVYFTSADGPDGGLDTTGVLQNSVGSFQNWFAGKTGKVQRQDTYQGQLDIAYFRSAMTDAEIAAKSPGVLFELYKQLMQAGFNDPNKRYLIYYDGSSTFACGGAGFGGPAAAMYLRAVLTSGVNCGAAQFVTSPTAPPRYWEFAMLHDSFHLGRIVDPKAPDHYAPNPFHVDNPADLMHGGPGGWNPSVVDSTTHNYYGDNVLAGVTNLRNDPILILASASVMASAGLQIRALREHPQAAIPYHLHELVRQLRK